MGCVLINRACLMDQTLIALREKSKLLSYVVLLHQLTALVFLMFHLLLKTVNIFHDFPFGIFLHPNEAYLTRISACAANLLSLQDRYGSWETSILRWRLAGRRVLIAPELSEIFICVSLCPLMSYLFYGRVFVLTASCLSPCCRPPAPILSWPLLSGREMDVRLSNGPRVKKKRR